LTWQDVTYQGGSNSFMAVEQLIRFKYLPASLAKWRCFMVSVQVFSARSALDKAER
jgi:hypothetical protein